MTCLYDPITITTGSLHGRQQSDQGTSVDSEVLQPHLVYSTLDQHGYFHGDRVTVAAVGVVRNET